MSFYGKVPFIDTTPMLWCRQPDKRIRGLLFFMFSFFFFNQESSQFGNNRALMTMHMSVLFVWQVDSVLGPLQLSLYKMLGNVWEFLLLFLVLHLSFATGLAKMYSYYVASQVELRRQNMTHYEETHHFARWISEKVACVLFAWYCS